MIDDNVLTKVTFDDLDVGDWYTDKSKCGYFIKTRNTNINHPLGWGHGQFYGSGWTYEYYGDDVVYRVDHISLIRKLDIESRNNLRKWEVPEKYKMYQGVRLPFNLQIKYKFT